MGFQYRQLYRTGKGATTELVRSALSNAVGSDGLEASLGGGGMVVNTVEGGGLKTEENLDASQVGMGSSEKENMV